MLKNTDFEAFEDLFNLPKGSTLQTSEEKRTKLVSEAVADKTTELVERSNKVSIIENMESTELIKADIDLAQLEEDRKVIMAEAFQTQRIAKMVLNKIQSDLVDSQARLDSESIDSIAKMLNSVVTTEKHLAELNNRYRQEEEMKAIMDNSESEEDQSVELRGNDFLSVIEAYREDQEAIKSSAQEATVIETIDADEEIENDE
jgi:hypothetical protein